MRGLKKFLLAGMVLFSLTGCGNENTEDVFKTAQDNMKALNNYNAKMTITMGMEASGVSMEMPIEMNMKIDEKNKTAKMDMSMTVMGMTVKTEGYVITENNQTTTYTKEIDGDGWTKEVGESDLATNVVADISNVKSIDSDDKDLYAYEATISEEDLKKMMQSTDSADLEIKGDVKAKVYVSKKDQYITKISMDLKDLVSSTGDDTTKITKLDITMTFSDFNTAGEVVIPAEVKDNATDASLVEAEEAMDMLNSTILMASFDSKTGTFTCNGNACTNANNVTLDLEDMDIPTSGTITINEDGTVSFDGIVINGYTCTYNEKATCTK